MNSDEELRLAALLGISLLERNELLSHTVADLRRQLSDRDEEISFLRNKVESLRNLNETRLKQLEQFEATVKELEAEKSALSQTAAGQKRLLKQLQDSLAQREEELEEEIQPRRDVYCGRRDSVGLSLTSCTQEDDDNDSEQLRCRALRLGTDLQSLKKDFYTDTQLILAELDTYRYELGEVCRWLAEDFISWAKWCRNDRTPRQPQAAADDDDGCKPAESTAVSLYAELKLVDSSRDDRDCCVGICQESADSSRPPDSNYKRIFEEIYRLLQKFNSGDQQDHIRSSPLGTTTTCLQP